VIAALWFAAAVAAQSPEVVAIVDRIDRNGMEIRLSNGGVLTRTTVQLVVVSPEKYWGKAVNTYCPGPPFIGERPLLTGARVTFRLPEKLDSDIALDQLKELRLYGTPLSSPIPYDAAKRVFDEARIASEEDNGKLWGQWLYGPLVFADPKTRMFIRDNGTGGELPAGVIVANTAIKLGEELTTMISWPAISGGSATAQRRLAMHECFHRIQESLGFPTSNANNAHLDTVDGRVSMQLELRALAAALRATGDERTTAIRDALAFRAARRAQFAGAETLERALENNEGLAEYTGWALRGTPPEETRQTFARHLDRIDPSTSFVRGFAYETGPAYGLLRDVLKPGWTRKYKAADDLAAFTGLTPGTPSADAYGAAALRAAEEKRDREQRERVARFRARLVDGPVIELPMKDANYGFDPNAVTALGDAGNAYASLEITAPWGKISVDDGARIAADFNTGYVSAEDRGKLELKPGWTLVPGARAGDLRVATASASH
jgi:hypothetical protein